MFFHFSSCTFDFRDSDSTTESAYHKEKDNKDNTQIIFIGTGTACILFIGLHYRRIIGYISEKIIYHTHYSLIIVSFPEIWRKVRLTHSISDKIRYRSFQTISHLDGSFPIIYSYQKNNSIILTFFSDSSSVPYIDCCEIDIIIHRRND